MLGRTYRCTADDRELRIENDYSRAETSRKGNEVVQRTEDAANVEMDRIDSCQVERCVRPGSGPRHASFVEIDG